MEGEVWTEKDCLIVWKSPKSEIPYLKSFLDRTKGALEAVYVVKDMAISGKRSSFFRPGESNPERFFLEFKAKNISYIQ